MEKSKCMAKSKSVISRRQFDPVQVRAAHHETDVACKGGMFWIGFFDVNQHCQSAYEFVRNVFSG